MARIKFPHIIFFVSLSMVSGCVRSSPAQSEETSRLEMIGVITTHQNEPSAPAPSQSGQDVRK